MRIKQFQRQISDEILEASKPLKLDCYSHVNRRPEHEFTTFHGPPSALHVYQSSKIFPHGSVLSPQYACMNALLLVGFEAIDVGLSCTSKL